MKTCRVCGQRRRVTSFDLRGDTGRRSLECKFCRRVRVQRTSTRSKEQMSEKARQWRIALRAEVFAAYNHACACCGEDEEVFLALDHVNNDGAQHRREVGRGGYILRDIIRRNFPPDFQVLCYNCNGAKAVYGKCPGHRKKVA